VPSTSPRAQGVPHLKLQPRSAGRFRYAGGPRRRARSRHLDDHAVGPRHWGKPRGLPWWCSEAPEAFNGPDPVYVSLAPELTELMGKRNLRGPPLPWTNGYKREFRFRTGSASKESLGIGPRPEAAHRGSYLVSDRSTASLSSASSSSSDSYMHQLAWSSSGSAPHSGHGSSVTQWRASCFELFEPPMPPFFTSRSLVPGGCLCAASKHICRCPYKPT